MASLPNKSFVFNFNAKNYNTSTRTIPNEAGASMDKDMVMCGTTSVLNNIVVGDDYIKVPVSVYSMFDFTTSGANPMNNTTSAPAMTVVAKFRYYSGTNFLCNRGPRSGSSGDYYNFMLRNGATVLSFHTSKGNASVPSAVTYDSGSVVTAVWRVNTSRQIGIKNLTEGTSNTPFTSSWNGGSRWFTFFVWKNQNGAISEAGSWDFYWCYASKEYLTDAEIQQVIKFNEGGGISIDSTGTTIAQSGGTSTTNIEAETGWTVTTKPTWVTVSPVSGESGTTAITFTIKKNNFSSRTGVVVFTDDEGNEAEYTIEQGGTENQLPFNKIYRNDRRIN